MLRVHPVCRLSPLNWLSQLSRLSRLNWLHVLAEPAVSQLSRGAELAHWAG